MNHTRKLGFGPSANEPIIEAKDWVEQQLATDFPTLGYKETSQMNRTIVPWPAELKSGLSERVQRARAFADERGQIRNRNASTQEKDMAMAAMRLKYETRYSDQVKFVQAPVIGGNHLKLRLTHFWLNHFTVGFSTTASDFLIGHYVDDAIYGKLDGSFGEMFYGVATHPAMLTYLDNISNIGQNSQRNRQCRCGGMNDNLARESMELHSVSPARGYTENDIREAAKIFAGWGSDFDYEFPEEVNDYWNSFLKSRAEPGEKTVLGKTFGAGSGALRELIDHLAADPMTADFLSRKLALHFIGESATDTEIDAIRTAWLESGGDLPTVHKAVAMATLGSDGKKFLWPLTWLFQLVRISGINLFAGFESKKLDHFVSATRKPNDVMTELGMDFWGIRQPNGFSDSKADWISTEHFERRIRFSQMLFNAGPLQRSFDDMIDIIEPGQRTKNAISSSNDQMEKFVILACSQEFFEV